MMAPEDVTLCMDGWCVKRGCGGYRVFLLLDRHVYGQALRTMCVTGADNLGHVVLDLVGYDAVCRQAWCDSCQVSAEVFDIKSLHVHTVGKDRAGEGSEEEADEEEAMGYCVRCSRELPKNQAYVVCVRQRYTNGDVRWVCYGCGALIPDLHLDPDTKHIAEPDPEVDSDLSGHMPPPFDWSDADSSGHMPPPFDWSDSDFD